MKVPIKRTVVEDRRPSDMGLTAQRSAASRARIFLRFGFTSLAARRLQRFVSQPLAGLQPPLKRGLGFSRGPACQQIFDRDVFVEVWPMDTGASSNDLTILPFSCGAMRKARVPLHRDRDVLPSTNS